MDDTKDDTKTKDADKIRLFRMEQTGIEPKKAESRKTA